MSWEPGSRRCEIRAGFNRMAYCRSLMPPPSANGFELPESRLQTADELLLARSLGDVLPRADYDWQTCTPTDARDAG